MSAEELIVEGAAVEPGEEGRVELREDGVLTKGPQADAHRIRVSVQSIQGGVLEIGVGVRRTQDEGILCLAVD